MQRYVRRAVWILVALGALALLVLAFRPSPALVDVAEVRRGDLELSVSDDGRTRVRRRYVVSAPIQGRLLRTPVEAGDAVSAGRTVVAEFAPLPATLLDPRSRAEAQARVQRAEAALQEAQARGEQVRYELEFADAELQRARSLHAQGLVAQEALDRAERDARGWREGLRAAEHAVEVARHELELARASLVESPPEQAPALVPPGSPQSLDGAGDEAGGTPMALTSPIDGVVLRVVEESERSLPAGAPILEVGDTRELEVVADFLSQDAVRVRPGMTAWIEGWGGAGAGEGGSSLEARVRLVSPSGVTRVSALGVEEQRVDVVADPVGSPEAWAALGDGYRVDMRVLLHVERDALLVPLGALFRDGEGGWSVFVLEEGRARLRRVEPGARGDLQAQVLSGLAEGEVVVLYPSATVEDGARVRRP